MHKCIDFEENFVELAALGRSFKLGFLYNYCDDDTLRGKCLRSFLFYFTLYATIKTCESIKPYK